MYINDEETDKAEELEAETTVELKDKLDEESEIEELTYEAALGLLIIAVDSSSGNNTAYRRLFSRKT